MAWVIAGHAPSEEIQMENAMRIASFVLGMLLTGLAHAAPDGEITSVAADATLGKVELRGSAFPTGRHLRVLLKGFDTPLGIVSSTETRVVATLPSGLLPGTYRVALARERQELDAMPFMLGANGAPGPAGPPGAQG